MANREQRGNREKKKPKADKNKKGFRPATASPSSQGLMAKQSPAPVRK